MSTAAVGNPGTIVWNVITEIASGISHGCNKIKEDSSALHDTSNFFIRGAQLAAHCLSDCFAMSGKGDSMLRGTVGVIDGGAFLVDLNYFIQGEWKNNSVWTTLETASFLVIDTVSTGLWFGEMGFGGLSYLSGLAGQSAAFSIFGVACSISASTVLGGLLAVPFGFQMARGIDEAVHAENKQQLIYGGLVAARGFTEVAAAVTACAAAIFGVATVALPAVLALGTLAALIAVGGYLYKQGNLDLIQKKDPQTPATV